jgi:cellobiose phosphorylase
MYRVGLETILGFNKKGDALIIEPRVPANWREYRIEYRYGSSVYHIVVQNEHGAQARSLVVSLDGVLLPDAVIPLRDDGRRHEVLVRRQP